MIAGWYVFSFGGVHEYRTNDVKTLYSLLKYQTSIKAQIIRSFVDSVIPLPSANALAVYTSPENLEFIKEKIGAIGYHKAGEVELVPVEINPTSTGSWALDTIKADSCWAYGYDGSGVLVVIMDTGIDTTHPYIISKWSGIWYDAVEGRDRPTDSPILPHGTMVAGVLAADSTGVAPGAKIAVVRMFGTYITSNEVATHIGFSKILEWKIDSGYDIRIYNGSWKTGDTSGSLEYWNDIYLLRMAGIIPVFALGNTPGVNFSPGNYPLVIGVGATNSGDSIASFSSQGPAPNRSPWNDPTYWPYPTWNLLKPDVVAPGQRVLTTTAGGGFIVISGTSLSSPITAGVIAIMLQKNPSLTFYDAYRILTVSTDTPSWGSPYPNNSWGWGRINAWKSLQNTPAPSTILPRAIRWWVGDGRFDGIDTLVILIKNYAPVSSTATFSLTTSDARVSVNTPPFNRLVPASDTFSVKFEISGSGISDGEYIPFTLKITYGDSTINYLTVPFGNPSKEYVSIDTTALKLSFTRTGKFFNLLYSGIGNLYLGSFVFGTGYTHVSDAWIGYLGNDRDFIPADTFKVLPFVPQGWYIDQIDSSGISFTTTGYGYSGDTFVYLSFRVRNTLSSPISGYLGFFADLDVGRPSKDTGYIYPSLRCVLMGAVDGSFSGYIGIQLLSPANNISFIKNSQWFGIMNDSIKYEFLAGNLTFYPDTVSDWSVMLSSGPYSLNPGDSVDIYLRIFYTSDPTCPVLSSVETVRDEYRSFSTYRNSLTLYKYGKVFGRDGRMIYEGKGQVRLKRGVYFVKLRGRIYKVFIF